MSPMWYRFVENFIKVFLSIFTLGPGQAASMTGDFTLTGDTDQTGDFTLTGALSVTDPDFPPLLASRSTALTNAARGALRVMHETTGDMADGFGSAIYFAAKDSGATADLASVKAVRNGNDGTGTLVESVYSAGTETAVAAIDEDWDIRFTTGGLHIGPGYTEASWKAAAYRSHSLIQAHKNTGGFAVWNLTAFGDSELNLIPSSTGLSVDRRIVIDAVIYNTNDGTIGVITNQGINVTGTHTTTVGDSSYTFGVSVTGRFYVNRSGGTSDADATIKAIWL